MSTLVLEYPDKRSEATSAAPSGPDLCLLLLGKTGYGKTASCNSILGAKHFKTSPSMTSITTFAEMASRKVDGRKIKVVDTPGLADTRLDTEESVKASLEAFNRGVSLCPDGFHALILVFTYGMRVTKEEKMAIEKLKGMLGKDIIRDYTILLITHGDLFDREEINMSFIDWYKSSEPYMRDLIDECDNRCVLFNNKTSSKAELSHQRQQLLYWVDKLQSKGMRYTNWLFDKAKETWLTLDKQRKFAKVINEVNAVFGDISTDLLAAQGRTRKIDNAFFDGLKMQLFELKDKITDIEEPEKENLEGQIRHMDQRILYVKEKQGNDELMKAALQQLRKHTEDLTEKHKTQMRQYQEDFMRAQEQMFGKFMEMMQDGMNRQMETLVAMQKGQGGGPLVAIRDVHVQCKMS